MNIGVFFGGKNTEHDVSIITGQLIINGLKELGHNPIPIYISKDGFWYTDLRMDSIDYFKFELDQNLKKAKKVSLNFNSSKFGEIVIVEKTLFAKEVKIELAFPALHGRNGEDGTIQGLFELLNIPYVGCDVPSSAITIDKALTKLMYQRFNIPTTKFIYFERDEYLNRGEEILKEVKDSLTWPIIVKPATLGSSIGISKVSNDTELINAIELALFYDLKVVVEECVEDLADLTVCIIGNKEPRISLIQESTFNNEIFSYEDKYLEDGGAQLGNAEKKIIIPANIDVKVSEEIKRYALEIYKILGCSGIARVDFLYNRTYKKFYANEVNPMPGTIYHHLWKQSGIDLNTLLRLLLEFAQEKQGQKNKVNYTFDSTILNNTNSNKLKLKGL